MTRRGRDIDAVRRQIERDGEYRPRHTIGAADRPRCENCSFRSMRLVRGLCRYCRHALGIENQGGSDASAES